MIAKKYENKKTGKVTGLFCAKSRKIGTVNVVPQIFPPNKNKKK